MKKDRYFEGLLSAGRDCINYGDGMDFPAGLIGDAENDYQRGERFAYRAFRDYENADAIDIITARLWKWGAEEELDRFLAFIGMDDEDNDDELTLDEFISTVHRKLPGETVLDHAEGGARSESVQATVRPPLEEPPLSLILADLIDWAASMGGFEAPVWDRARAALNKTREVPA